MFLGHISVPNSKIIVYDENKQILKSINTEKHLLSLPKTPPF